MCGVFSISAGLHRLGTTATLSLALPFREVFLVRGHGLLEFGLLEESLRGLLVHHGEGVKLLEQALSDFIVLVFEELLELAIVLLSELLRGGEVRLHESVNENGALLQMGVSASLHDLLKEFLEKDLRLWCSLEEKLEDSDE